MRILNRPVVLVFVIAWIVGLAWAFWRPIKQAHQAKAQCESNMGVLSLAMSNYTMTMFYFPRNKALRGTDHQPVSWRVQCLAYADERNLSEAYNKRETWDSVRNRSLAPHMPKWLRCPSDGAAGPLETSYVMPVGPGTVGDTSGEGVSSRDLKSPASTLVLAEVASTGINWMEPRDLTPEEILQRLGSSSRLHGGRFLAAFADGQVRCLNSSIDRNVLTSMMIVERAATTKPQGDLVVPTGVSSGH